MPNVSDVIGARLYAAGCRYAFGIPGGEVLTLIKGLSAAGIRFVLTKHENSAGFMAEGTFHSSDAPALLVATLGPGVANAVNVVANARQDRVPMIFITGCVDARDSMTYTHQVFDHSALLSSITKATFKVTDDTADVLIDKALSIALDDPPGPVHLDLPISVADATCTENKGLHRVPPVYGSPAPGPYLDEARQLLSTARRPIMIAGLEVLYHHSAQVVADLVTQYRIPLITTYKAKGILAEDDPLSLGAAGLAPKADRILFALMDQCDLIILAGYDPIEMRSGWRNPWDQSKAVIEISAVPNTHYMHQAQLSFVGHVGLSLETLFQDAKIHTTWPNKELEQTRRALRQAFPVTEEWGPAAVVDVARRCLPQDSVVTVDSGAHRILLSQTWTCYKTRSLLQSTGLCTMGCAVPLAMGFKLIEPKRPVAAFVGDAGLEMVLGELATARDLALALIIVVFVDESLALIELKQRGAGHPNVGVDFGATDFAKVADALGGVGVLVSSRTDLEREINTALARDSFTVISCEIGKKAYDGKF